MAVKIDPAKITGPWDEAFALDRHTVSSVPSGVTSGGYTQFSTTRTELGELVYQFKYGGRTDGLSDIVSTLEDFVRGRWRISFDCVVPAPPSVKRKSQPVVEIAPNLVQPCAGRRLSY